MTTKRKAFGSPEQERTAKVPGSTTTGTGGAAATGAVSSQGSRTPTTSATTGISAVQTLSTDILHHRLWAGLGNKGGARGSLTRCVARWGAYLRSYQEKTAGEKSAEGADDDTTLDITTHKRQLLRDELIRELQLQQIEMTKLLLIIQRCQDEMDDMERRHHELLRERQEAAAQVVRLRREVQHQEQVTACSREYEALAQLAASKHPTSLRTLQEQMDRVTQQIEQTQQQLVQTKAVTQVRENQFHLLMQCIADLKQSVSTHAPPLELEAWELAAAAQPESTTAIITTTTRAATILTGKTSDRIEEEREEGEEDEESGQAPVLPSRTDPKPRSSASSMKSQGGKLAVTGHESKVPAVVAKNDEEGEELYGDLQC